MFRRRWFALSVLFLLLAATPAFARSASIRLEWIIQGQFAGEFVALDKGYYKAAGVDMKLLPGSNELKPAVTVAEGIDGFGIGHPNQVISARSNGVPLVMVTQYGQKSASVYIVRTSKGIRSIADMPGHSVGLWTGGDEQEFLAMLRNAGIPRDKVKIVPQPDNPIPEWMQGDFDVMQVTIYNELQEVYRLGVKTSDLVILDPSTEHAAIINTGLFTTEKMIRTERKTVQAVVNATLHGWQDAAADPAAAAAILLKYNPELKLDEQIAMIRAMDNLFCAGPTLSGKFGYTNLSDWQTAQTILLESKQIDHPIDLSKGFTNRFWAAAPAAYKRIDCKGSE